MGNGKKYSGECKNDRMHGTGKFFIGGEKFEGDMHVGYAIGPWGYRTGDGKRFALNFDSYPDKGRASKGVVKRVSGDGKVEEIVGVMEFDKKDVEFKIKMKLE